MDRPGSSRAVKHPQRTLEVDYDVDYSSTRWILIGKINVRNLATINLKTVPNPNTNFPCTYLYVNGSDANRVEDFFKEALEQLTRPEYCTKLCCTVCWDTVDNRELWTQSTGR